VGKYLHLCLAPIAGGCHVGLGRGTVPRYDIGRAINFERAILYNGLHSPMMDFGVVRAAPLQRESTKVQNVIPIVST